MIFTETKRFILRALTPNDATDMLMLDSDPDVHQYLGKKPISTLEESLSNIDLIRKQYVENGIGRWAIIEKQSNCFVGWAGLKLIKEMTNNHINYYDLGYRLIKKYWGQGIATEVALASLNYGFNVLKQNNIYAIADINNHASVHVLEKIGFSKIEIFLYDNQMHHWLQANKK